MILYGGIYRDVVWEDAFLCDDIDRTCFEFGDETGTDMNDFVWGDLYGCCMGGCLST